MLGQAGHETGWGKSEIRNKDGSNSFNLFGIKAGKGWTGKVAESPPPNTSMARHAR
jgi:flagellar protein FlgJ